MSIEKVVALDGGFHSESELRMMNRIADGVTDGVIVALGSYRGQMDCALALHAHVPVYCIGSEDEDRVSWLQNILALGVGGRVRPIALPSTVVARVWSLPVSLLMVNAPFTADLAAWLPHVAAGGLIAFSDGFPRDNYPQLELIESADKTNVYRLNAALRRPVPPAVVDIPDLFAEDEPVKRRTKKKPTTRRRSA